MTRRAIPLSIVICTLSVVAMLAADGKQKKDFSPAKKAAAKEAAPAKKAAPSKETTPAKKPAAETKAKPSPFEASSQEAPQIKPSWTISEGLDGPESIYYDIKTKAVYISNVAGKPNAKDGKGWITKADASGKVIEATWVDGLNAPKGMDSFQGVLYVSDIDRVVPIDLKTGKAQKAIEVPDAKFLNDVAIDPQGTVYVADTFGGKIFEITDGKASIFVEGSQFEAPNGLVVHGTSLVVASLSQDTAGKMPGRVYAIDLTTKEKMPITFHPLGHLDGLALDGSGGHFVTDHPKGVVYRVSATGDADPLLTGLKGPADLTVAPDKELLIIPLMQENKVSAYDLGSLPL